MSDNMNERIKTPEQLDNYIHVTSPGAWIILLSTLILLAGFTFWIFTGEIETPDHEVIRPLSFVLK